MCVRYTYIHTHENYRKGGEGVRFFIKTELDKMVGI